jgi:acetate kinase
LAETGMPPAVIRTQLSRRSGLVTLLPQSIQHFADILADSQPSTLLAREILFYKITESIGAEIATLGGLDALVFIGDDNLQTIDFIKQICRHLAFLNIHLLPESLAANRGLRLTAPDQPCQVISFPVQRWQQLAAWL